MSDRIYIAIDLKSFYSSVECVERSLDPLDANLVVADVSRTEKTICLAVSPPLKSYGIPGRARLFEVVQKVREVNRERQWKAPDNKFSGESHFYSELINHPELAVSYIAAPPRMALYIDYSTRIYKVYLKYVAPEDIFPYSIDEVFMDVTNYLAAYKLTARELAMKMILDVLKETGITATAGIGTNMYLCKIAMDIEAKHIPPDENGVRIAELDEMNYRRKLWSHRPLTDFWRVGHGYAEKLEKNGILTMGDVARCSIENEDFLYRLFGINAELLIDHAWGWEPVTLSDVKAYKPENKSISSGQVLQCPYDYEKTKLVVREMADALAFDLLEKKLITNQIVLTVGYDKESLENPEKMKNYTGDFSIDRYGRKIPKHAHGTANLGRYTSSAKLITDAVMNIFQRTVNPEFLSRRINICVNNLISEDEVKEEFSACQLDLFSNYEDEQKKQAEEDIALEREKNIQKAVLKVKNRFGKNSVIRGMDLLDGATAISRNGQIGGHRAGESDEQ